MIKIDEGMIYDTTTGIRYTLGIGWNYSKSLDEANETGETWPIVSVDSAHSSGESYGLVFEKQAARTLWSKLLEKVL